MQKIVHLVLAGIVADGWTYQDNMLPKYHKKIGYDVTVITTQWIYGTDGKLTKDNRTQYVNEHGVLIRRLLLLGKDSFEKKWKKYKGLAQALEEESPDILFIHGVSFGDFGVVCNYLRTHAVKKVYVDNHMDSSNSGRNWLSRNILHRVIWKCSAQMLNKYADKFYGVLPVRVTWLTEMYGLPKDKCELLVMGADDDVVQSCLNSNARQEIREKHGIADGEFLIVTGGKIDEWKTQTLLLMEAVRNINNKKIRLIVFGSVAESLRDKVNELTDGDLVQYIGWVSGADSYSYWAAADLVVFPGRHSVFWEQVVGMGVPMVCKYWDGTDHVDLGGNVEFLKEDSVDEIQNAILAIFGDKDRYQNMKQIAKTKGIEYFSYRDIARRSLDE